MIRVKNMTWATILCVMLLGSGCQSDEEELNTSTCFSAVTSVVPAYLSSVHRTTINQSGTCFWTQGDKIFVKNGTSYVQSNNAATKQQSNVNFYVNGTFTANSYPVLFTGTRNAKYNSVTIKAAQKQTTANDATHLGTDGDCGTGIAYRNGTGAYSFQLEHKASYLNITPVNNSASGKPDIKLTSIKVQTSGTDNLCGTYTFSENTLNLKNETNSAKGKAVTLTVNNFNVPTAAEVENDASKLNQARAFIAIQPGVHKLTFIYTDSDGSVHQRETSQREYLPGHFTNVRHLLLTKHV